MELTVAFRALGIGPGYKVITTAFSLNATLNAILEIGANVRFANIRYDFTADPDAKAALVNDRTVALLPVHRYGLPADIMAMTALAAGNSLAIMEDAGQACGAVCQVRSVGPCCIGGFSPYVTKNITCGDGGLVTTNDDDVARTLRNKGMRARYDYEMPWYNWRLTDLQAAAIPQVNRLAEITWHAERQRGPPHRQADRHAKGC